MNIPPAAQGSKRPGKKNRRSRPQVVAPFRALIAYADIPAARRAINEIQDVLAATRRSHELHPLLWRFDQLAAANWSEAALRDATDANVIVLASTESGSMPPPLECWLAQVLSRRQGATTTIIAVLGMNEAWTISIEKPERPTRVAAVQAAPSPQPAALPSPRERSAA